MFRSAYLLGAMLLLTVISCENGKYSSTDNLQIAEMKEQLAVMPDATIEPSSTQGKTDSLNTEDYDNIVENRFLSAMDNPQSTFSIDVDEAAYSNVRRYIQNGSMPPKGAVRIEELINYFDYDYPAPENNSPFETYTEIADCPWNDQHQLVHIGLQGKEIATNNLPPANMVFLIDVSGSMQQENKLPLVQSSLKLLAGRLREIDKVSIVVYAGAAGVALSPTKGSDKAKIFEAIDNLEAGGSTAGAEGIRLAYQLAAKNFIKDGNNRVILATDGDFNVGVSSDDELVTLIEKERKSNIFLTVLGYGMGNYKDNKMQQLADKGNGNHAYIDNINEAKKVLVNEFGSTMFTIAKDVKLQIEFNPAKVQSYRLIGYENRMLAKEDFNDDAKDAGELGSGHTVTALYEIIPVGVKDEFTAKAAELKYQTKPIIKKGDANEIMTIHLRYKEPEGNASKLIVKNVEMGSPEFTSDNFRFAAAVASFGMLLRNSAFKQNTSYEAVIDLAGKATGDDKNGYRKEFIELVQQAASLATAKK